MYLRPVLAALYTIIIQILLNHIWLNVDVFVLHLSQHVKCNTQV